MIGAARRGCGGIYKERFQSNQRRLTIKTFSVMKPFSRVCVDLSLSLSSFGEVFSGGQILIGGFLEEQSRTQAGFIPSL